MSTRTNDRNPYFRQNLRLLRKQFNISQEDLAEELKVKANHGGSVVSGWERGDREPSLNMVCEIANYFGVTIDWLLGRDREIEGRSNFRQDINIMLLRNENKLTDEDKRKLTIVVKTLTE